MTQYVLDVKNLTKAYPGMIAVNDVSFSVRKNEIMGFLGPNGAGKTTTIRMILGILKADSGEVIFHLNGHSGPLNKEKIGYLPEERGLYDDAKVLNTLIYLATLKGVEPAEARKRALSWLEAMGLQDYANHKLEKLSKGMQQKVQFIATIIHNPPLVVLDEPFSGLDPINQDLFKQMILKFRDEGITILLSAHQMNVVQELCDRIFLIHNGQCVLQGTLDEIRDQHPENTVYLRFTRDQGLLDWLKTHREVRKLETGADFARFRLSTDIQANDFLAQAARLCAIKSVSLEKPSLHEIFITTVQGGTANEVE
jgi:ABC-2 type transport system ATP-binding protein